MEVGELLRDAGVPIVSTLHLWKPSVMCSTGRSGGTIFHRVAAELANQLLPGDSHSASFHTSGGGDRGVEAQGDPPMRCWSPIPEDYNHARNP